MSCCLRSAKMTSTPSFSECDWCGTSFDAQVAYLLHTQETATQSTMTYHIGEDCCMGQGKHAEYANRYIARWHARPSMFFEYLETPQNVTHMFARAKRCHERGRDKSSVKALFQCAWRAYKKLSPENQALVTK
jgi:hypothetical protein